MAIQTPRRLRWKTFTTQKAKFLFVMPAEATSLVPKLIAARKAGVSVLVAGGDPGNSEAYDAVMMMNQFLSGSFRPGLPSNGWMPPIPMLQMVLLKLLF